MEEFDELHQRILKWIAETIRRGYIPANSDGSHEIISSQTDPIVDIKHHSTFISALFNRSQARIAERRKAVRLFTTNYDTLIENTLALEGLFVFRWSQAYC